jgi:hypothetical protein
MWTTRRRIRARLAALTPAVATLAVAMSSPLGAELALADAPTAARGSAGVVYGGMTSNGWPVIVEVTRDGRFVKRMVGGIFAKCNVDGIYTFPSQWRDLRISRAGVFKEAYVDTDVEDGLEVTYAESFAAKFNRARTRITGKWRASAAFQMPDGAVNVCDTGPLRFTAQQ